MRRSTDHRSAPEQSYHPSGTQRKVQERECAHEVWLELRNLNFPMQRSSGLLTPPDLQRLAMQSLPPEQHPKARRRKRTPGRLSWVLNSPVEHLSTPGRAGSIIASLRGRAQMDPSGPIQECNRRDDAQAPHCVHIAPFRGLVLKERHLYNAAYEP